MCDCMHSIFMLNLSSCSLCVWTPMHACVPLWSSFLSNTALQSTSWILTKSLRNNWEHQNLSAVLQSQEKRETEGGREGWPIHLQPLRPPPFFCISPFFSCSCWQIEAKGQNVDWLNISDFLSVVPTLIGSGKDCGVCGLAQTMWPCRILPFLSILLWISNTGQSWPTFLSICTMKERIYEQGMRTKKERELDKKVENNQRLVVKNILSQ